MNGTHTILASAWLAMAGGLFGLSFRIVRRAALVRPALGNRGLKRARALSEGVFFARIEPLLRHTAAWMGDLHVPRLRTSIARDLRRSGDYLGLCEDELLAMSLLSGISFAIVMAFITSALQLSQLCVVSALVLGAMLPVFRVKAVASARASSVTRSLPGVIELAAMCMGAGLDFPRALRRIVESAADSSQAIIEELRRVLQELDLGHTRRAAMAAFSERVPSDEVRELVNSVVQSEEKGTPLARVLTIQARTLRLRRSVAAEETASEAALMLIGPMSLIFLCVIALLLGPVVLRVMTGGLVSS